jgi:hypothetical protein
VIHSGVHPTKRTPPASFARRPRSSMLLSNRETHGRKRTESQRFWGKSCKSQQCSHQVNCAVIPRTLVYSPRLSNQPHTLLFTAYAYCATIQFPLSSLRTPLHDSHCQSLPDRIVLGSKRLDDWITRKQSRSRPIGGAHSCPWILRCHKTQHESTAPPMRQRSTL